MSVDPPLRNSVEDEILSSEVEQLEIEEDWEILEPDVSSNVYDSSPLPVSLLILFSIGIRFRHASGMGCTIQVSI